MEGVQSLATGSILFLLIILHSMRVSVCAGSLKQSAVVSDDEVLAGSGASLAENPSSNYGNAPTKRKGTYTSPLQSSKNDYYDLTSPAWKEYTPSPYAGSKYISGTIAFQVYKLVL